MNYDQQIEKMYHPENFLGYNPDEIEELKAVEEFELETETQEL